MKYLAQDLMLLALNSETGSVRSAASEALPYGLIGAMVLDLVLQGKVAIDNKRLVVIDSQLTGDEFLDRFLHEVVLEPRAKKVQRWVEHWHSKNSDFRKTVLQSLVNLGILAQQEVRELWVFRSQRHFFVDPSVQYRLIDQVRAAVFSDVNLDSRMAALISLVQACELTNTLFDAQERREAHQRMKAISRGELVGKAVSDAVSEIQAALIATITAVMVTSTASSSGNN